MKQGMSGRDTIPAVANPDPKKRELIMNGKTNYSIHMKERIFFILLILVLFNVASAQEEQSYFTNLWYTKPAADWNEALPVGNGRLGAMVF